MAQGTGGGGRGYHHGDLRASLISEALALARATPADAAGPDAAISLREVTRRAGVSPTAAYRHFRDRRALLVAVAEEIQLRMVERMRAHGSGAEGVQSALDRLRGVGLGYVDFAIAEPGWFTLAFFPREEAQAEHGAVPPPLAELLAALDDCVDAGVLTPAARAGAEYTCWSAVHGCALLMVRGPLRNAPRDAQEAVTRRVVDDAIRGVRGGERLSSPAAPSPRSRG